MSESRASGAPPRAAGARLWVVRADESAPEDAARRLARDLAAAGVERVLAGPGPGAGALAALLAREARTRAVPLPLPLVEIEAVAEAEAAGLARSLARALDELAARAPNGALAAVLAGEPAGEAVRLLLGATAAGALRLDPLRAALVEHGPRGPVLLRSNVARPSPDDGEDAG